MIMRTQLPIAEIIVQIIDTHTCSSLDGSLPVAERFTKEVFSIYLIVKVAPTKAVPIKCSLEILIFRPPEVT